jgi:hypothetical protein
LPVILYLEGYSFTDNINVMNNVKLKIFNSYSWNVDMADYTDGAKHDYNTIFEEMVI